MTRNFLSEIVSCSKSHSTFTLSRTSNECTKAARRSRLTVSITITMLLLCSFVIVIISSVATVSANQYGFGNNVTGDPHSGRYTDPIISKQTIFCTDFFSVPDSGQTLSYLSWQINPSYSHNTPSHVSIAVGLYMVTSSGSEFTALALANGGNSINAINYDVALGRFLVQNASNFYYPTTYLSAGQTLPTTYSYALCIIAAAKYNLLTDESDQVESEYTGGNTLPNTFSDTGPGVITGVNLAMNIVTTGSGVNGDPQFIGLRGQSFQVHGIDQRIYNIISDRQALVNARFTFLEGPRSCPILPFTKRQSNACWSHAGSYLSAIAVAVFSSSNTGNGSTQYHFISGAASSGFTSILLNNVTIKATANTYDDAFTSHHGLTVLSSHEVRFVAGPFVLEVENIDNFLNIRSVATVYGNQLRSHGLLGQTWNDKTYAGKVKEIEGEVDDYTVTHMFATDFPYNQFEWRR